jgi:hypothetical protein
MMYSIPYLFFTLIINNIIYQLMFIFITGIQQKPAIGQTDKTFAVKKI